MKHRIRLPNFSPWPLLCAMVLGCGPRTLGERPGGMVPENPGEMQVWVDALHLGTVDGFAAAGGGSVAASWQGGSWRWSAVDVAEVVSLTEGPVTAAATTDEGLWVVLDDELLLFDDVLRQVDWTAELGGPVVDLRAVGERLYLFTDDALFSRFEGRLSQIFFDGQTPTQPLAFGGYSDGVPVLWIGAPAGVFALDPVTGDVLDGVAFDGAIIDLAIDASGRLHVVAGKLVYVQSGGSWQTLPVLDPVGLQAEPAADGVWIATETGWMHNGRGGLNHVRDVDEALSVDAAVDGLGRLLHTDSAGLWRTAANRPIEVLGLRANARIEAPMVVSFVPTAPDEVVALTARMVRAGDAIDLLVSPDWTATIDPLGLVFGNWTLEVGATYADESTGLGELSLKMAASGGASWTEHVQPIYTEHCSNCHDGASETVLVNAEDWSVRIDRILENVISGEMPLVGPDLSTSDVALIQAWAAGGFPN